MLRSSGSPLNKRPAIDITVVFGLILATIWVAPLLDRTNRIGYATAIAAGTAALASTIFRKDRLEDIGVRLDNFFAALRLVAIPTLVFALVIIAIGAGSGNLHFGKRVFPLRLSRYLWPFLQQYLMLGFLNRRLQDVLSKGRSSLIATALIFAGMHAPNPALMMATFLGGVIWAWTFQRQPNLFATTLSHILLGAVLGHSLPDWLLPNMKVGWAFWR
jgi:membrane protease YdiL (CAAX protease family)